MDIEHLRTWIGKTESRTDQITPTPIAALSATLDRDDPHPQPGDPIPSLWHYLYFLPIHRNSELGTDGMAMRGGFLPPVELPRRMFAGSRQEFHRPLHVGEPVTRVSRIMDVTFKEGRIGKLVFVLIRHEISNAQGLAVVEEQDAVYRENPKPTDPVPTPQKAPTDATWTREVRPNEVMLFRYSALTFNGHRIHYDKPYTTGVEGYREILVQGSFIAVLLHDLLRRHLPNASMARFSSRSVRPIFNGAPFLTSGRVEKDGKTITLWATDSEGFLAAESVVTVA